MSTDNGPAAGLINGPIHHIGYVVDDIPTAVEWAASTFGAGPFFCVEHVQLETCTFNGAPAEYDHSSAFGQWGPIRMELTVVHSADPPELGQMMVGAGTPRVGHIALVVDDLEAESARLAEAGMPLFHTGSGGTVSTRWHDARSQLGHHVEVLRRSPQLEGMYELLRSSAENWDGSEPLRFPPRPGS